MFSKIVNRLFYSSRKANENYTELRELLSKILLPEGFVADLKGDFVKYQRGTLLVELYFDKRDWLFAFFASKNMRNPVSPPRQVSLTFFPNDSTADLKIALQAELEGWFKTLGNK